MLRIVIAGTTALLILVSTSQAGDVILDKKDKLANDDTA